MNQHQRRALYLDIQELKFMAQHAIDRYHELKRRGAPESMQLRCLQDRESLQLALLRAEAQMQAEIEGENHGR